MDIVTNLSFCMVIMTSSTALEDQIREIYQLKTSAEFIAIMASLNDKGMRRTPLVVFLNSQKFFQNFSTGSNGIGLILPYTC